MNERTDDRPKRAPEFQRNPRLEEMLTLLENPLSVAETALLSEVSCPSRPIVLIVGCARSGSTLLLQLLAQSGVFAYPSNFISRFYAAPVLGGLIQRMLFDPSLQFRDELGLEVKGRTRYHSELGKTEGALSPNEFHYFWRRWFEETRGHPPTLERALGVPFGEIEDELQGLASIFERPLVLKASLLSWMLPVVAERIPDTFIIFQRRDPLFTAQSLLEARVRFFGSEEHWYSYKPPEYEWLAHLPPAVQVAGQALFTERAIEAGIRKIDASRVASISYEELSASPGSTWRKLAATLATHPGCPDLGEPPRTTPFQSSNVARLAPAVLDEIRAALDGFHT